MTIPRTLTAPVSVPLATWTGQHADQVERALAATGAVLLRGFTVSGPQEFRHAVRPFLGDLLPYVHGASPRTRVTDGVYTSTEWDSTQEIPPHHELAYSPLWPARIAFYCAQPPALGRGGQTPLVDGRTVFARVTAAAGEIPDQVTYIRHQTGADGPGVSWRQSFGTDDKDEVSRFCTEHGIDHAWLPGDTLRTAQSLPTAIRHPVTGEPVWFNQMHLWHASHGGPDREELWRDLFGEQMPMHARTGVGAELPAELLTVTRTVLREEAHQFDWQFGDVLLLDNMLTAHGRRAFQGERTILVAMGGPVAAADVKAVTFHV
ncbi:TauD/TfdA family dioxygenase [Streptomyces griseoincarnatus]